MKSRDQVTKALLYARFGDPSVLRWDDAPAPSPLTPHSVVVAARAGSVNPKDVLLRKGKFRHSLARDPLPRVAGFDVSGTVIEVGSAVSTVAPGDRVFGMSNRFCGGVHRQQAVLQEGELAKAPSSLSLEDASAIPLAALTALQALRDLCHLRPDARVLINGASGGVGHFAVQIAGILGARVYAVCGAHHLEFVASLGADVVTDYAKTPAPTLLGPFDAIFDVFGKYAYRDFASRLGAQGVFVSTVPKPATLGHELLARLGLGRRSRLVVVKSNASDLEWLARWAEAGRLRPHIDQVYSVDDAAAAHRHLETRRTTGKVVLSFDESS